MERRKQSGWLKAFKGLVLFGLVLTVAGTLGIAGIFWYYGQALPDIESIGDYNPKQVTRVFSADGELIELWTDEELMYRTVVPLEEIPAHMRFAVLAAEDADFFSHGGLDIPGLLRAVYHNLRTGSFSQGASTITQQVVKNLVLSPERSIRRKVQEVLLAYRLEDTLTKEEILTLYLNELYLGRNRYGVEEASRYYFGHSVSEITLDEAALLAGLIQSPERINPYRHPEEALARREFVLTQMWNKGFIEEAPYRTALEAPLVLNPHGFPHLRTAPYYTNVVRRQVFDLVGRERVLTGGLRIYTALRLDHQLAAQQALRTALRDYDGRHDLYVPERQLETEADITQFRAGAANLESIVAGESYDVVVLEVQEDALLVALGDFDLSLPLRPTDRFAPEGTALADVFSRGDVLEIQASATLDATLLAENSEAHPVLAMPTSAEAGFIAIDPANRHVVAIVGGYDAHVSAFNRATMAHRQNGSAFKPFIYGAALASGLVTPATIVRDEPTPFRLPGGRMWNPQNSDGDYLGAIPLREALARSRNVVSVRLLEQMGLATAQAFARSAGITSELTDNLTMALGSSEIPLIELVNSYATIASGGLVNDPIIVTRIETNRGELLWEASYEPVQALDPAVVFVLTDLMRSVVEIGTARAARALERPAAGKTGTTNEARDALFLGFVPQLVAGAWVGFDDHRPLGRSEYGGRAALPIWLAYMQAVLADEPTEDFLRPDEGIVRVRIDPANGLLAPPELEDAISEWFVQGTEPTRMSPLGTTTNPDEIWLRTPNQVEEGGTTTPRDPGYDDF